jgi:hypothetical protein
LVTRSIPPMTVMAGRRHPRCLPLTDKFPVTFLFALQYGALVLLPAVVHDTAPMGLIVTICAAGTGTAFTVEALRAPLGARAARPLPLSPRAALPITAIGAVATAGASYAGGIAYANQVNGAAPSHLAAIFTPLSGWLLIGTVLVMAQAAQGTVSRRRAWLVIAGGLTLEVALGLRGALLTGAVSYACAVTFLAIVLGFARWRPVIAALVVIPLALPALYNFKTAERAALVSGRQAAQPSQPDVGQRLRLDREMALVGDFPAVPATSIAQPGLLELTGYGVIPRALDPGRPALTPGLALSVATGGPANSATTATALGDAYLAGGWAGVVLYSALAALVTGIVIRRRGPWAYALLGVIAASCLLIGDSYPDMLASLLQECVSLGAAFLLVRLLSRKAKRETPVHGLTLLPLR